MSQITKPTSLLRIVVGLSLLTGCGARTSLPAPDQGGGGAGGSAGGAGGMGGAGGAGGEPQVCTPIPIPALVGTIRDLTPANPDFEGDFLGDDRGIVGATLGPDRAPTYEGQTDNPSTHGDDAFFAWFHDVPGANLSQPFELSLGPLGGASVGVVDDAFFPIDGQLLGNQGREHNYHFTLATSASFRYFGGEVLGFAGDDDLFVFIDDRLVLDLGGVHSTESGVVDLGAIAASLNLAVGSDYVLDLFFAERHTTGSTFRLFLDNFRTCEPTR
ncbi:MAG: fibro-slime domain-containing protein [Polyangiaceae bacterium]